MERSTRSREPAEQTSPVPAKIADERAVDGRLEVGVGEHDVGALAAELQADLLHVLGGPAHDALADLDGAGEGHHVDVLVAGEVVADLTARAGHDLEHALGQPGLLEDPRELEVGERAHGGRLEDHHVAGGEGGAGLPRRHEHRVVPRRDADGDADGLAHHHAHGLARYLERLAVLVLDHAGVQLEGVRGVEHVHARLLEELAHLHALEPGEVLGALAEERRGPGEDLGPLHRLHLRPRAVVEGVAGRAYRLLGVGHAALGYARYHFFGRRIDDVVGLAAGRVGPAAVDVHLVVPDLGLGYHGRHASHLTGARRAPDADAMDTEDGGARACARVRPSWKSSHLSNSHHAQRDNHGRAGPRGTARAARRRDVRERRERGALASAAVAQKQPSWHCITLMPSSLQVRPTSASGTSRS